MKFGPINSGGDGEYNGVGLVKKSILVVTMEDLISLKRNHLRKYRRIVRLVRLSC